MEQSYYDGAPLVSQWLLNQPDQPQQTLRQWKRARNAHHRAIWWQWFWLRVQRALGILWREHTLGTCAIAFVLIVVISGVIAQSILDRQKAEAAADERILRSVVIIDEPPPPIAEPVATPAPTHPWLYPGDDDPPEQLTPRAKRGHRSKINRLATR